MSMIQFPVIDPVATGANICRLRKDRGLTVRDLQRYFGFEEPQAIYKWISGKSLPNIDNFIILSRLLHTSIEDILVIDGDISYYIGNFISYVIKASGRMRTAAYNEDVASDRQQALECASHILCSFCGVLNCWLNDKLLSYNYN